MNAHSDSVKTLAKGAGVVIIGAIISKLLTYFYRIFIARYFGPADYGLFSLAIAVISFAAAIALLGTKTGIMRYVAHYMSKGDFGRAKGSLFSALRITMPVSIAMSVVLFILSPYIADVVFSKPELGVILMILSFSIPFTTALSAALLALIGIKKLEYNVFCENIARNASMLAFTVAFGLMGFGLLGITWAWFIGVLVSFVLSMYFVKTRFLNLKERVKAIYIDRELISYSLPLFLSGFVASVMLWVDTLMLGFFKTSADVGIYNASLPTAQLLTAFPLSVSVIFFSIITGLHAKKLINEVKKVYTTFTRWIIFINTPILLIFVFFSKQVLREMFGPQYMVGYLALIILSIGFFLRFTFPAAHILNMMKRTRDVMYIILAATVMNFFLNLSLIPVLGITGAAISTAVSQVAMNILFVAFSYRFIGFIPRSAKMIKTFIAGFCAMAVVYFLSRMFFQTFTVYIIVPLFVAFLALYVVLVLVLRCFDSDDIELVKIMEKRTGFRIGFLRGFLKRFM